ncbi:MAG: adenylyl-sulfate kinase [Planctomycetes bacterium]|nr:adenylyl-sulfate kinase [Planctomycetota bacterium]
MPPKIVDGATIWLTGLSGSGKSTIAQELERQLVASGRRAVRLDGDELRRGMNQDLGFDAAGRQEAVRRAGEAALLQAGTGAVAIVSMISPYKSGRDLVRQRHGASNLRFIEVFVDCPLAIAEKRDPKGLYRKARAGLLKGMTGIDDPYEAPQAPEVRLDTSTHSVPQCVDLICIHLRSQEQIM